MPNGKDILQTLLELYSSQENIKVKFEITERRKDEKQNN